jgi:hypothetical protein
MRTKMRIYTCFYTCACVSTVARVIAVAFVSVVLRSAAMAEINPPPSKVNSYRGGVDQPLVTAEGDADTARYCRQLLRIAPVDWGVMSRCSGGGCGVAGSRRRQFASCIPGAASRDDL